jgi:hypothetical protein
MPRTWQHRTEAEKAEQRKELFARIEKGVDTLTERLTADGTTAAMAEWAAFAARFHRYSFRNQILIRGQRPDATLCAGFRAWQGQGRAVRKGEKGIAILAPGGLGTRVARRTDAETGEEREDVVTWQRFRVAHVFDVGQTEGSALPCHPSVNLEDARADDLAAVKAAVGALAPVVEEPGDAGACGTGVRGWTDGSTVHVRAGLPAGGKLKTLCHEAAHMLLHCGEGAIRSDGMPSDVRELEAETVAAVVCGALGYRFDGYAAAYLASYGATPAAVKASLPRIRGAAAKLLDLIDSARNQAAQAAA